MPTWPLRIVSLGALAGALVHLRWPDLAIDAVTVTLLLIAVVSWLAPSLAPSFKSVEIPGGLKFELRELQRTAQQQSEVTSHQTIATVLTWVQAEHIRESRGVLYKLEEARSISTLPAEQWEEHWKQAADRVSQAFNSAGTIAKLDPSLHEAWIRPARRSILRSWNIAQPRIEERRHEEGEYTWEDFKWLAEKARTYLKPGERALLMPTHSPVT